MKEMIERCKMIARSDSSVMLYGETGTGKELVAPAQGGYPDPDPFLFPANEQKAVQKRVRRGRRGARHLLRLQLAGQCTGVAALHRARHEPAPL